MALPSHEGVGTVRYRSGDDLADALAPCARGEKSKPEEAVGTAVAALAVRLAGVPDAKLMPYKAHAPLYSFAPIHRGVPFIVIEWRMEPGAVLLPHNHPGYSVCTVGLEGEARMRHYQPAGDAPPLASREPFRVRLTREQALLPRGISTLGPERDNIHTFIAGPRGARGIDVTTLHAMKDTGFSFLEIREKHGPSDDLEARFTGM